MIFGRLNIGIQPSMAIKHQEDDAVFTARDFHQMLGKVQHYRSTNGGDLAPGWQHRLGTSIVEQNPEATANCSVSEDMANYRHKVGLGDVGNFLISMARWKAGGGLLVSQEEANRRASICAQCPHNSTAVGCKSCSRIGPKIKSYMGSASTPYDSELDTCDRCGCNLPAKVWLPHDVVAGSSPLPLPEHCWMKDDF